jgi:hypothetical protein
MMLFFNPHGFTDVLDAQALQYVSSSLVLAPMLMNPQTMVYTTVWHTYVWNAACLPNFQV